MSSSTPHSQRPGTHFVGSGILPAAPTFDAGAGSTQSPDAGGIAGSTADASAGPSLVSPGSVSQDTANLLALVNFIPVGGGSLGGGSLGSGNHHDGAPAGPGGNGGGGGDGQTDIKRDPPGGRKRSSNDPLWVLDVNNGLVLTGGETIHDFSGWTVDLYAQISGVSLSATDYHWDTHLAPDATNVTVTSGYHLQFTWATFCGADKADTISITTNPGQSPITQTFYFTVYAQTVGSCQGSPAWSTPTPRPFGTNVFPLLVPPDAVLADQQTIDRQYYSLGEATGEVMTHFTLPSYHPAVAPLQLDYSSLAADSRPIFTEYYQLSQTPITGSTVTATLKLNGVTQGTSTYDTHLLNFRDILAIALQGNAIGLSTGRYPYEIDVTENSTVQTPQTGSVDIVNSATSPFGAGWSLDNLEHLSVLGSCTAPTGALVELPGGKSLWYTYNAGSFVAPAGDFSTFRENGSCGLGLSFTRTLPDGTQYSFDSSGNQTSIYDQIDARTTTFTWVGGKLVSVSDFLDNPVTLTYNGVQVSGFQDPVGRTTQLAYTGSQLTSITDPNPSIPGFPEPTPVFTYGYDSGNKLTNLTDPNNHQSGFAYSSTSARVSTVTRADNTTESLVPQQATGLVASGDQTATLAVQEGAAYTDPRGKAWFDALDWSGFGHPTELFDPLLDESVMHRNSQGLAWLAEDPLDRATRAFFDNNGNPTEYALPDRHTELYTYNGLSEVASFTDANGHTVTMGFSTNPTAACRCPTSVTKPPVPDAPLGPVTTLSWTGDGFVQSQEDPNNNAITYHYDGAARVGYLEEPPDAPAPTTNPTVTFGYNSENYLTSVTDELSHVTNFTVDNLGRVLGMQLPLPMTMPPTTGGFITMTFDPAGNRTSLIDPTPLSSGTDATQFHYDAMNRVDRVTDPNGQPTTYVYDNAGNLQDIYDRDTLPSGNHRDRHFIYDDVGRLLTEQWKDGSTVNYTASYGYDAASELTSASDDNSAYSLAYDNRGHQISTDNANTPNMPHVVLTSVYDGVGNRTAVEDNLPNNGSISFTYDADNRLTNLVMNVSGATDHPIVTLQYDPGARLTSISRTTSATGNQVNTALTYTQRNLVQSITHTSGGSLLAAYTYGYDPAKNLQTKSEYDNISLVTLTFNYTYDPLNQLTGVAASNSSYNESYSYTNAQNKDLNGNRSSASFGSASQTYGAPAADNRLTTDGQYTYTYDNAGNLVNKTGMEGGVTYSYDYTYDFRNRLKEAKKTRVVHGVVAADDTFTYDVFDRRIGKLDVFGTQQWTTYDGDNAYADFSGQTLTTRYLFANGLDKILARTNAGGNSTAWYLTDKIGSVRRIVDASGGNLYHVDYFTFGGIVPGSESGSGGDRFKFAGRELDSEIGLYYNRARYYDANTGRFISEDPIGFRGGQANLYAYVGNQPTEQLDPTGRDAWSYVNGAVIGAAAAALVLAAAPAVAVGAGVLIIAGGAAAGGAVGNLLYPNDPGKAAIAGGAAGAGTAFLACSALLYGPAALEALGAAAANAAQIAQLEQRLRDTRDRLNWNVQQAAFAPPGSPLGEHFRRTIAGLRADIEGIEAALDSLRRP